MNRLTKHTVPRVVVIAIVIALGGAQWLFGEFPLYFFAMPMNLLLGALWLALLWEGYRHRATSATIQYLLSAEATYTALALAAILSAVLGLQSNPATTSWLTIGGFLYIQTVLTLVILRGWRNDRGVRWRFLATHCGLWLAVTSALLGAPDKEVLRTQVGKEPTREVVNEQGAKIYLDYELRLDDFVVEHTESGTPEMFRATVAIDEKIVDIEVNSPYHKEYGEDIYLVSYNPEGGVLQIVREPWRVVTTIGIALLLLGAFMLFLHGFGGEKR